MKLRFNQLRAHLDRQLAAVYLIAGDEPLQAAQAADAVREAARARGFDERLILDAESGFDWTQLRAAADNLSLFATKRLLDLRLPAAKPGVEGGRALVEYVQCPPPDTTLLIQSGKLSSEALKSGWLDAVERAGVIVQVWPVKQNEMGQWIAARLAERRLELTPEAVNVLAERAQGNLLAANQEMEKLALAYGDAPRDGPLDAARVMAGVADSARFNVFELADAAVSGDCARAVRTLYGLAAEDTPPALALWSLSEQARLLAAVSWQVAAGKPPEEAIQSAGQQRRSGLLKQALRRGTAGEWEARLRACARADRVIKGQEPGRPWDELLTLTLGLCGRPLFAAED